MLNKRSSAAVPAAAFAKPVCLMAVEMTAGARPCYSLSRAFSATAQHRLSVHALVGPQTGSPRQFLSLRLVNVATDTYECIALLGFRPQDKVRAVSLLITRTSGQWRVTNVDVG